MRGRRWLLLALPVLLVLAGHSAVLYLLRSHLTLSVAAFLGVVILVALLHLGRRWSQRGH